MPYKKDLYKLNDKFRRTSKEFAPNVADHNKARCEWIGKGKTFSEISAPNSVYRQNIINERTVEEGLHYDIEKRGWIEKKESRSDKFKRLSDDRLDKAKWSIQSIGKLSDRSNYAYEEEEVNKILAELMFELKLAMSKFGKGSVEDRFKRYIDIDFKQIKATEETDPELYDYIMKQLKTGKGANLIEQYLEESRSEKKEESTAPLVTKEMLDEAKNMLTEVGDAIKNTEDIVTGLYIQTLAEKYELGQELEKLKNDLEAKGIS